MKSNEAIAKLQKRYRGDLIWPCLIAAMALHLIIIFGVRFGVDLSNIPRNQLAVTVALNPTDADVDRALHVAQENQIGAAIRNEELLNLQTRLSIVESSEWGDGSGEAATAESLQEQIDALAREVSSIAEGRRGGSPRAGSVAARRSLDAAYLARWRARVEQVGNALYSGIRGDQGDGDVRLLVTIAADGRLLDVDVIGSSGNNALDIAALATVRRAAPFPPFPADLAEQTQVLEIVRTWQFRAQSLSSG